MPDLISLRSGAVPASVEDRRQREKPSEPWDNPDSGPGPRRPDVDRPETRELLERMRRIDPRQARRYRQRSGE